MLNDRMRRWEEVIPEEIETRIDRLQIQDHADGTRVDKEDSKNGVAYHDIVYYLILEDDTILSDACTQRDITREFEVSKTTATNNLKQLVEWGVLTADTDREPYEYELNPDLPTSKNPPATSTSPTPPASREESTQDATPENEVLTSKNPPATPTSTITPVSYEESTQDTTPENEVLAARLLTTLASLTTSLSALIETDRPREHTLVLTIIWLPAVVATLTPWVSILPAVLTAPIIWGLYTLARNHRHTTLTQLLKNTKAE
ncbi:winged helix-turn-helix domain-containing protein [Halobacterium salinarum]|uniref:winged helix-turn-helix domain-containing protein n=1 Tax=Halobacterium salinarum TaxID=2242 RepID=UPI002554027F|nr:winged helix-turn-helix domain-containing protein [Halobacterium salinarum]MDL0141084.1 winged helix-turn-helix domain-containing protein [Halobacterium salinarum]